MHLGGAAQPLLQAMLFYPLSALIERGGNANQAQMQRKIAAVQHCTLDAMWVARCCGGRVDDAFLSFVV